MISQVDIDDMKPEDTRRVSDNHQGWVVEAFHTINGWSPIGTPYPIRELAVASLISWQKFWPGWEFRVNERVK